MFINTNIIILWMINLYVIFIIGSSTESEEEDLDRGKSTGKQAKAGQFPFAIRLYSRLDDETVTYCTAAVITKSKLLTAGHCCHIKADRFVVSGDPDQTDFVSHLNKFKYNVYDIKKVIIHPKFERSDLKLVYDLCLLFPEKPLDLKDDQSIQISYDKITGKKNCTALGWGSNIGYKIQHKLHYKEAIAYRCNLRFGNSSKYWFVCLEPHSVCPGDSGGPLVCDGKIQGIASFFIGHGNDSTAKCEKGVVDYYSELSDEREFIEKSSSWKSVPSFAPLYFIIPAAIFYLKINE